MKISAGMSVQPRNIKRCVGFTPFPWQRAVISDVCRNGAEGTYVVKSRRQCGKSVMCENILLWYALNHAGSVSAVVSPTLAQARKLFRDIVEAVYEGKVMTRYNETLLEITFINKSRIFFRASEQKDALRGYTLKGGVLILDECVYIPDDILPLVLPWTQVHRCPVLMVSTPKFKNGFFYRYFSAGMAGEKYARSYDWTEYDTSALLSAEQLEMYRQQLPKNQFLSEYMGEFLDTDGMVFTGFRDCMGSPEKGRKLYVGIDFGAGGGNDFTVLTAVNDNGEQEDLIYFNTLSTTQQIDALSDWLELNYNRIELVVPELNSIGTPMTELLMERFPTLSFEGFKTTNQSKGEIVVALQKAFEKKEITILEDASQAVELGAYSAEYNPRTHNTSYNAPLGLHDDKVMALCFAWYGYLNATGAGYSVSFL